MAAKTVNIRQVRGQLSLIIRSVVLRVNTLPGCPRL